MRAHIFSNWLLVLLAFGLRFREGENADCLQTNPTFSLKPTCVSPPQSLSAGMKVVNNNKDMRSVYDNIYIDTGSFDCILGVTIRIVIIKPQTVESSYPPIFRLCIIMNETDVLFCTHVWLRLYTTLCTTGHARQTSAQDIKRI